jgi:hypothetical protein
MTRDVSIKFFFQSVKEGLAGRLSINSELRDCAIPATTSRELEAPHFSGKEQRGSVFKALQIKRLPCWWEPGVL